MRIKISGLVILSSLILGCTSGTNDNKQVISDDSNSIESISIVKNQYVDTSDLFGRKIYDNLSPNQFLEHLKTLRKFDLISYTESPDGWIKKEDIDTLILRMYDTTKVPSLVNPLSSYLPFDSSSCIGREAQNMIISYIENRNYLEFLWSFGEVDSLKANELKDWYNNKKK